MASQGMALGDAIGSLAEQKTLAESHGAVLKQHVSEQAALIKGQQLYGEARAKFDALIQRLLFDLTGSSPPKDSVELLRTLEEAISSRVAFSELVGEHLPDREGARDALGIGETAQAVADVVNKLIESAVTIWQELRGAKQLRRETIRNQIEAQRWCVFTEL